MLITNRAFALTERQASGPSLTNLAWAGLVGVAFQALAYYFLFETFFSRLLLVEAFVIQVVVICFWHIVMEQIVRTTLTKDPPVYPLLIVGLTRESRRLIQTLQERRAPLKPVAILDAAGTSEREAEGIPVLGKLDKLEEVLTKMNITHLLQASSLEQSLNLLSACRSHGITYMLLPSVLGIVERDERVASLEGFAVTMVAPERRWWKGLFE